MSIRKQIEALTKKRNAHLDAMSALSETASTEDRLFTEDEQKAFDKDQAEVRDIDAQLGKLGEAEKQLAARAQPVPQPGPLLPSVEVKAYKPFPGQGFVRLALAVARTKGNFGMAAEYATRWKDQTPEVYEVLAQIARSGELPGEVYRAAVAAGTTTHATWAGPLVYAQNLTSEFIEFLRPATILGKLPLRPVPFNVSIPRQTGGASVGWVGQGLSKPVSQLNFDRLPIPFTKVAVIVVITDELARFSDPSAEMLVRDDLVAAIAQYLDGQFTDPAVAAVANVNPASITNGVAAIPAASGSVQDINTALTTAIGQLIAANMPFTSVRWLMNPGTQMALANQRIPTYENYAFPELSLNGTLKGYPIIASNTIPLGTIILIDCSQVLHAADPVVDIEASSEASLQMDTAPATPPTPMVSLWQQNMLGIKAEQYQYWAKRHPGCVALITGVTPVAAGLAPEPPPAPTNARRAPAPAA
jgi:HK97 family phage major capsid protein